MQSLTCVVGTYLYTIAKLWLLLHVSLPSAVGTPEVTGLTPIQAMEIVRGCRGLNLIGADVVEVNVLLAVIHSSHFVLNTMYM